MSVEAIRRNIERIERIEQLLGEIRKDDEFMAHLARSGWCTHMQEAAYDGTSYLAMLNSVTSFVFDFSSALEDELTEE